MLFLIVGFSGCGKTTNSLLLAKKINYDFLEMDLEVLHNTAFEDIKDVYSFNDYFWQETEIETSKYLSRKNNLVISTTGGIVDNKLNFTYFKENQQAKIIYLANKLETLKNRIKNKHKKDLKEFDKYYKNLVKIYNIRHNLYQYYADFTIHNDTELPEQVTNKIINYFEL